MNRTILSLAVLKTNWTKLQKDYLENFIPFIATLIVRKKYAEVDPKIISDDFHDEFGLVVPIFPTISILKRAATRKLLSRDHGRFTPDFGKATELDFTGKSLEQQREMEKVLSELRKFALDQFGLTLDEKGAEDALIAYLREHDLDILFASETQSPLPEVSNPKRLKYIVNDFIKECFQREPSFFRFILDITIGHALASTILYNEFNTFAGKLNEVTFYFDTRFIIRLLGLEGYERQTSTAELVKVLHEEKAKLRIFEKTLSEIEGVLYNCIDALQRGNIDLTQASRVLRYFRTQNKSASDVEQLLVSLKQRLSEHNITIDSLPDVQPLQVFQIDEDALLQGILDRYSSVDPNFDRGGGESMVRRDVEVISGIFRLRKGAKPRSIKDSKAIFVTPNSGLAIAVRKFETASNGSGFFIPACVTDVFVGTLLWLQSPSRVAQINEKRIIADSYAALQPSELLIKKYVETVEQMKTSGTITSDEYYLLRTHRTAFNLLEEKTLGDPDAFDAKTPEEILDEIEARIKSEDNQKLAQEQELHAHTRSERDNAVSKRSKLEANIDRRAQQLGNFIANFSSGLIYLIFIVGIFYQLFPNVIPSLNNYKVAVLIIVFLSGAMGLLNGFNILSFRTRFKNWLKNHIQKYLIGNGH